MDRRRDRRHAGQHRPARHQRHNKTVGGAINQAGPRPGPARASSTSTTAPSSTTWPARPSTPQSRRPSPPADDGRALQQRRHPREVRRHRHRDLRRTQQLGHHRRGDCALPRWRRRREGPSPRPRRPTSTSPAPHTCRRGPRSPAPAPPTSAAARPRSTPLRPWWPPTSSSQVAHAHRRHSDRDLTIDDHRLDGLGRRHTGRHRPDRSSPPARP